MEIKSILIQALIFLKEFLNNILDFQKELYIKITKSVARLKKQIKRRRNAIKKKFLNKTIKIKLMLGKIKYVPLLHFFLFVFSYGLLINYVIKILLNFKFTIFTVPAWGIFYYFIREELVGIIRKIKGR